MDNLFTMYEAATHYPRSLISCQQYSHTLDDYEQKLKERSGELFDEENEAALDVWQSIHDSNQSLKLERIYSLAELTKCLRVATVASQPDPKCRFSFVHAPDSRSKLRISKEMMLSLLTYLQVTTAFLDYLFCFGEQTYEQDFNFGGLYFESTIGESVNDLCIPGLGRSGNRFQICYGLRSVEPAPRQKSWPWSIRPTAIYHSFDVATGTANWIVIKGSESMKRRMIRELDTSRSGSEHSIESLTNAFAYALAAHLVPCIWAGENWRWYINYMEAAVQKITRRTLTTPVVDSARAQGEGLRDLDDFTFDDLQEIQWIEEKASTALLVIGLNVKVLYALLESYEKIFRMEQCPAELLRCGPANVRDFSTRMSNIIRDLQVQTSRVETLVRLLGDRKTLLYGILEYRSMETSKMLAEKAQVSATHMEEMTLDMHDIARKTKQEAVSMRVITLVTLVFLPGTFIATLMSTDIVRWETEDDGLQKRVVSSGAIVTFLAITLPLMLLTFSAWYAVYWWLNAKQRSNQRAEKANAV